MMHKIRRFQVGDVGSAEDLAEKLVEHTWCSCNGFRLGGYLFLNDSTSADGAQEYAVVREDGMIQIESVTFGWMKRPEALQTIREVLAGKYQQNYGWVGNKIETPVQHGYCGACA